MPVPDFKVIMNQIKGLPSNRRTKKQALRAAFEPAEGVAKNAAGGCSEGETFPSSKDLILNTKPVEKESTQQAIERIEAIDVIRVIPADYDVFAED